MQTSSISAPKLLTRCDFVFIEYRVIIQTRRKDGWSPNRIAAELGCAPNTVRNELRQGIRSRTEPDLSG